MKLVVAAIVTTLLVASPALAQLGGVGTSTTGSAGGPNPSGTAPGREVRPEIRDFRDRPFGSMGTGSIMGSTGTYSALGTGGSIGTGTGHGSGIGADTGPGKDLGSTGYRFSPHASPTSPAPADTGSTTR